MDQIRDIRYFRYLKSIHEQISAHDMRPDETQTRLHDRECAQTGSLDLMCSLSKVTSQAAVTEKTRFLPSYCFT